jgi:hypothetical protein
MATVSLTLAFATLVSILASLLNRDTGARTMWLAFTLLHGFGLLLSLTIRMGGVR